MSCSRGVAAPRTALRYGAPFGSVFTLPLRPPHRVPSPASSPTPATLLRPADSLLVEAHDEWQVADQTRPFGMHPGLAQRTQRPIPAKRCSSWGADGTVKTPQSFGSNAPLDFGLLLAAICGLVETVVSVPASASEIQGTSRCLASMAKS
jgi:hypothetical protein